ncbi:hypothetical protein [Microbulbifer agarilyticus]
MKIVNLIVAAALSASAIGVQAEEPVKATDRCKAWSQMAEKVMKGRQLGAPMSAFMEAAEEDGSELMKKIVVMAYEQPRYSTEQNQVRAADEFRDEFYLMCIKG